jgi:hypothetical protein
MALMNPTPIWVMGIDASSTNQLEARVGKSPMFYQNGVVLINLKHGPGKSFEFWDKSSIRKTLLSGEDYAWSELELPAMMPRAAELIGSMPLHTVIDKGICRDPVWPSAPARSLKPTVALPGANWLPWSHQDE